MLSPLRYLNPWNPANWTWGLRAFVLGFFAALGVASFFAGYASVGCSRPPPVKVPEKHTINTELSCYVVESERGGGLVCTEDPSACRALQKLTAVADGVTAISECRAANVIADAKE